MSNFYGIGIVNTKTEANIGTLWRSAHAFGASFIFTVGRRYRRRGGLDRRRRGHGARLGCRRLLRGIATAEQQGEEEGRVQAFHADSPCVGQRAAGNSGVSYSNPHRKLYLGARQRTLSRFALVQPTLVLQVARFPEAAGKQERRVQRQPVRNNLLAGS